MAVGKESLLRASNANAVVKGKQEDQEKKSETKAAEKPDKSEKKPETKTAEGPDKSEKKPETKTAEKPDKSEKKPETKTTKKSKKKEEKQESGTKKKIDTPKASASQKNSVQEQDIMTENGQRKFEIISSIKSDLPIHLL